MKGIYLFLNGDRGVAVLEALAGSSHIVEGIITPPNRAALETIRQASALHGLVPRAALNVNTPEFIDWLCDQSPELTVVAGYSAIFGSAAIGAAKRGTINLHGGLLPQYRGGSPLNWQIANGETVAGCSVVQMDEGIDTGAVLAETTVKIGPDNDIAKVHELANHAFPTLVVQTLDAMEDGSLAPRLQNEAEAGYWHQRNDADGLICWERQTAGSVFNLVRAITRPYPGAHSLWDGKKLRIFRSSISDPVIHGVPGRVVYLQGKGPSVVCADRSIRLDDYAFEGDNDGVRLPHGAHLG